MTAWFIKLAAKLGLAAIPGGGIIAAVLGAAGDAIGWVFGQIAKAVSDCLRNPRVFLVIGIALVAGNSYGWNHGFDQGAGDLKSYKQQAEIFQRAADATAADAKKARIAAEQAEAAKILAEKRSAEASQRVAAIAAEAATNKVAAPAAKKAKPTARRRRVVTNTDGDFVKWFDSLFGI